MATGRTKSKAKTIKAVGPVKAVTKTASKPVKTPAKASIPSAASSEDATLIAGTAIVKKPELVDRIVAQSGLKKKDVKPVVEATLAVLSKTLLDGEELQIPPLGKVKILQTKDAENAKILKVKIRHSIKETDTGD